MTAVSRAWLKACLGAESVFPPTRRETAKVHVQHIIAKLGVSDRTQAVIRALDLGLLTPESE